MPKITIRDVARHAGVGVGTVSRVLNNSEQVSEETRTRVLKAIDELGFKPNAVARQLPRKTRFKNIGVVTPPFLNYYSFAERLRGVQKALNKHHAEYEILLFNTRPSRDYRERLMSVIQTGVIDGLLIIDLMLSDEQQQALYYSGLPFVGLNHLEHVTWPRVGTDNVKGGYLATRFLLEHGHRNIAYIGDELVDSEGFVTSGERYAGYKRALREYSLAPDESLMVTGLHGYQEAKTMTYQLLDQSVSFTAIFAMSDHQALGCMEALRERGLQVPDDISVIGYDDLEMSYHVGLTTVRQHLELSGELSMAYLLKLISDEIIDEPPQLPPVEVIVRDTVSFCNMA